MSETLTKVERLLKKFEGNTDQEGMIWIDDAVRVVKEWLQQKRVEYLLKNPRMWAHTTIDELLEEIIEG